MRAVILAELTQAFYERIQAEFPAQPLWADVPNAQKLKWGSAMQSFITYTRSVALREREDDVTTP
jgi:hypothetical protein